MNPKEKEAGLIIGFVIIAVLLVANIYIALYVSNEAIKNILIAIYIYFLGSVFLAAFFFENKSFIFRWAIWICEHFSSPGSRKMAFFYFVLAIFIGSFALYKGISILLA